MTFFHKVFYLGRLKVRNMNSSENKTTIAVIGAGIVGVNSAAELQARGYQVTILDKAAVGEGCSKGNAGHFATEQVFPLAEASLLWQLPKFLLDPLGPMSLSPRYFPTAIPWFIKFIANMFSSKRVKNSTALKTLNKRAIDYYKTLFKAANVEHLLVNKGSLLVFESTSKSEAEKCFKNYSDAGVKVKLLSRQQVLLLEPNLSEKVQHALYFTDVGHTVSPYDVCQAIANYSYSLGARFQQFQVNSVEHCDNYVKVIGQDNSLEFDQVVIATGAWSKGLLANLGYQLPIEAERGYSFDLPEENTQPRLTRPVASADRKFIITPMAHGLRLAGTVEFAGLKQKANMKRATMLYQHAKQLLTELPELEKNAEQSKNCWLGFRPSLPDSLPVISKAPKHNNITFALGHQHLGLTLGAVTGKLVGQIIDQQSTDIDITPFCISRFN